LSSFLEKEAHAVAAGACTGRIAPSEKWSNVKGPEAKKRLRNMVQNGSVHDFIP
jgi:hypothetical protein